MLLFTNVRMLSKCREVRNRSNSKGSRVTQGARLPSALSPVGRWRCPTGATDHPDGLHLAEHKEKIAFLTDKLTFF